MKKKTVKEKIKNLCALYWTMFKIGLTTFGGGYAMVAIIDRELSDKKHWIEKDEILNYIAISQITPGVMAVNVSTFVGRKRGGVLGAAAATLGVVTPSILIIMLIAAVLVNFADNAYVMHAFAGIRICVCAIILNATIGFIKKTVIDVLTLCIFLGVFITAAFTSLPTVYIVLGIIVLSIFYTLLVSGKKAKEAEDKRKAGKP